MAFKAPELKAGPFGRSMGPKLQSPAQAMGKTPPAKGPTGLRIEDRIGVQAPAEVIWEIVADLPSWSEWNPTYTEASGVIRIGEILTLNLALPGQPHQLIKPTVLEWVPNEQLHWRLSLLSGMIRTTRYIEIEQLAEASCVIDNGEIFGGLMGKSLARRVGRSVRQGFRAMNEALKARAEMVWQSRR